MAVLGRDVYLRRMGSIEPWSPNSWHVDPNPWENREAYLRRTWNETRAYINSFPTPVDGEPLFVIVSGQVPGT